MITRQDCFKALVKLKDSGIDVSEQMKLMSTNSGIPEGVIKFLSENSPQFQFYRYLHKHQKTLMKSILDYESFDTIGKIKLCSSMITRAAIAVEYKNLSPVLVDSLDLDRIAYALNRALSDKDYKKLDEVLSNQKENIKLFLSKKENKLE